MYDEVMQLIALAKNDEQYFKRIEVLKEKQLELAHVMEIAKTLNEADMHLAKARQDATELIKEAKQEAEEIKKKATDIVVENKALLENNKSRSITLTEKEAALSKEREGLKVLEKKLDVSIAEHRKLTAERTLEKEAGQALKREFETKLRLLREIANQT